MESANYNATVKGRILFNKCLGKICLTFVVHLYCFYKK